MDTIGIAAMIVCGMVVNVIPMFLFFEIYYWERSRTNISKPSQKGFLASFIFGLGLSFIFGLGFTDYSFKSASGESSLVFPVFAPFIIFGFMITGFLIACLYMSHNKPLLLRRRKKLNENKKINKSNNYCTRCNKIREHSLEGKCLECGNRLTTIE
ncbi:MAG: hypothetical protein ACMUJM_24555 [bacterium]